MTDLEEYVAPTREVRDFDLADILSVTTGALLSHRHMDGVYDILSFLTRADLMTHELPDACAQCQGPLLEQHPQLTGLTPPQDDIPAIKAWLREMEDRYGATLAVTPVMTWGAVEHGAAWGKVLNALTRNSGRVDV